jgi:hypothetical protein
MISLITGTALVLVASIGAASASAESYWRTNMGQGTPVALQATSVGVGWETNGFLNASGGTLHCEAPSFAATVSENDQMLTTENATGKPCWSLPTEMNGCEFSFSFKTGQASLGPENCGPVVVYWGTTKSCFHHVTQLGWTSVTYFNAEYQDGDPEVIGLHMRARPPVTTGGSCSGFNYKGEWNATWVVKAPEGTDLWISEFPEE